MCGITGAVWWDAAKAVDVATLHRMRERLVYRGPDDAGEFFSPFPLMTDGTTAAPPPGGVALGHRRLAIIDRDGGRQPLSNEDGSVWVVFNGEIYNHHTLRRELTEHGHRLTTRCDTEVLVHLYEEYGVRFPERLHGMFALAIVDLRRGRVVLARDRLGEKPLVYCAESGRIVFASEMKSLFEVPGIPLEISPEAVDLFLTYQYVPHPATIYAGIRKLAPGEVLVLERPTDDSNLAVSGYTTRTFRYWNPDFTAEIHGRRESDWIERIRTTVTDAVRERLESDVPLGTFLSGGVDSTIIAGLVRQLAGMRVRTFSIGFPEPEYDETRYAREVAEFLDTDHTELRVEPDAVAVLPRLVDHYDEPFADSSAVPTWYVSEITRRHVTVALTGDGGDELFGGYQRYRAAQLGGWFDALPGPLRRMVAWGCAAAQHLPIDRTRRSRARQMLRFFEMLPMSPLRRYLQWIAIFHENQRHSLYRTEFRESIHLSQSVIGNPYSDRRAQYFLESAAEWTGWMPEGMKENGDGSGAGRFQRDIVSTVSLADIGSYLPCDILTKVDIASMAHSLETRPPLLDHRVVELAASIPASLKIRHGRGKYILRKAFAELLPESVQRRPKMGFGVPLGHWFRGPLRAMLESVLLSPEALDRPFFQPDAVRKLVAEHVSGRFDHAYRLWSLLIFEMWQRQHAGMASRWSVTCAAAEQSLL